MISHHNFLQTIMHFRKKKLLSENLKLSLPSTSWAAFPSCCWGGAGKGGAGKPTLFLTLLHSQSTILKIHLLLQIHHFSLISILLLILYLYHSLLAPQPQKENLILKLFLKKWGKKKFRTFIREFSPLPEVGENIFFL